MLPQPEIIPSVAVFCEENMTTEGVIYGWGNMMWLKGK